ncbi:MAG TPA: DNA primase [Verrucomicrobiae bacterium]|jgi:DNA primase|nr:DNA primase [Verrucomicrobiae bacterium]
MAEFFSDNTRERIRSASDIVDIIGSYVPLKRAGANFVALCPFHKEKSPSFNVNPQRQIFHCFGCHKGGDVFTFVQEYENIPFPDAVRRLAERAKIPLETENNPAQQQTRHIKDSLLQIHEQIAQRWQNALATEAGGQIARDYLAKRGVSEEAIKIFRLGYAPDAWDDTVNWAKSKGHELALVEQGGLILAKDGGGHYDRFRGRLMFPICDEQARIIGFSGRVLSGDQKTAKYVNSPETPIFTKGKVFFGLDKSKRALLDAQSAIVCEGQLDLIACFMSGVQNIVAPQGTALTADHARILKRYVDEVVLCFDSDNAGQNAAVRSLDSLLASGLAIRVALVPAPHDPDSFIKEFGGEAFKQLIEKADGFFDYYLNRLCATNDLATDKGRLAVLEAMAEAVHKTGNVVLVDKYAQKTALRLSVSPEAVRTEFKKASRLKRGPTAIEQENAAAEASLSAEAGSTAVPEIKPTPLEYYLLKILLLHEDTVEWIHTHFDPQWVLHHRVREILLIRLSMREAGTWQGVAALLTQCEAVELRRMITEATAEDRPIPNTMQQLTDIVLRLRNQFVDRQLTALTHRAAQPELGDDERLEVMQRQQSLRQLKRQPLAPLDGRGEEPF